MRCARAPKRLLHDGRASDGHASDGHTSDGRASDGRASDGHASDGHASEPPSPARCADHALGLALLDSRLLCVPRAQPARAVQYAPGETSNAPIHTRGLYAREGYTHARAIHRRGLFTRVGGCGYPESSSHHQMPASTTECLLPPNACLHHQMPASTTECLPPPHACLHLQMPASTTKCLLPHVLVPGPWSLTPPACRPQCESGAWCPYHTSTSLWACGRPEGLFFARAAVSEVSTKPRGLGLG